MKSLDYVIAHYQSDCLDGRDITRLASYVGEKDLNKIGIELKDEYKGKHQVIPFTRDNVLHDLKQDVLFGWEKAINERGISSSLMHSVVCMWNWILEEGLEEDMQYDNYGKSLFLKTAKKYGWDSELEDN